MSSDFLDFLPRFSYFSRPITNTQPSMEYTLLDAYHYIIGGVSELATETCRSLPEDRRKVFKKTHFDYCTFSGIFTGRNSENLVRHSMLFCFDFDHLKDVEATFGQLINDRYFETMLLFRSPSGDGLKWVVSMEQNYLRREKYFPDDTPAKYHPIFFELSNNTCFPPTSSKPMANAKMSPAPVSYHTTRRPISIPNCHDRSAQHFLILFLRRGPDRPD